MASQYTAEFRQRAVRVALTIGLSRKQVAADFGVGFSTLFSDAEQYKNGNDRHRRCQSVAYILHHGVRTDTKVMSGNAKSMCSVPRGQEND